jgi:deoxyadenosine/deoxycytidine kinase
MSQDQRPKVVIAEGLIGVGKTTFCKELGGALGDSTLVLYEHDQEKAPDSFHHEFYDDMRLAALEGLEAMKRYPLLFQMDQLSRRFGMQQAAQWWVLNDRGDAVLDRSFYGDTCFARMLAKSGHISPKEFLSYARLYKVMTHFVPHPNVCIRLLIHPEHAKERIDRRAEKRAKTRGEEISTVGVEYLRALDEEITYMTRVLATMGVYILDVPWDAEKDTAEQRARTIRGVVDRIRSFEPPDLFLDLHRRTT